MKCSGPGTVSAAPNASLSQSPARAVAAQFAAELTRVAFAPLAKSLGFYGDAAIAATAQSMAARETGGLTDELERIVERAR
jgi:hypothetical protein